MLQKKLSREYPYNKIYQKVVESLPRCQSLLIKAFQQEIQSSIKLCANKFCKQEFLPFLANWWEIRES